jgi:hypothetical protein
MAGSHETVMCMAGHPRTSERFDELTYQRLAGSWTDAWRAREQARILRHLHSQGQNMEEVGGTVGMAASTVCRRIQGLARWETEAEEVLRLRSSGKSWDWIAGQRGAGLEEVYYRATVREYEQSFLSQQ